MLPESFASSCYDKPLLHRVRWISDATTVALYVLVQYVVVTLRKNEFKKKIQTNKQPFEQTH